MSVWVCSGLVGISDDNPQKCGLKNEKGGCCAYGMGGKPCDAVEYAPVKRGKWLMVFPDGTGKGVMIYKTPHCSVCKSGNDKIEKYCPSCGAKMEDEDEKEKVPETPED